ncbi:MAG: hypothetical protein JSU94_02505 [Phycisphaerales bacterium]|nr:MAG: hypothetical protein JSU94_02505 [Phycisphaerales bacterium]
MKRRLMLLVLVCALAEVVWPSEGPKGVPAPRIEGRWWQVAGNPMDHKYATPGQEPVDFAVWRAADGSWQLWSCIRNTTAGGKGGKTRFFYRWEGQNLTDENWTPMGIAMEADPSVGETPGGLQAPHVVKVGDTYHMFYGDWVNICHAISTDGKSFKRVVQPNGKTGMFTEGPGVNTRDVLLMRHDDRWYAYYTAYPNRQGMVFVRTTEDFANWSESSVAAFGGQAGTNAYSSECPHVVKTGPHDFYLFRTQSYGAVVKTEGGRRKRGPAKTSVYYSNDPKMFGINQDARYFVGTLPVAAPEIIRHEGRYYIAALNDGALDGIRIAALAWVKQ